MPPEKTRASLAQQNKKQALKTSTKANLPGESVILPNCRDEAAPLHLRVASPEEAAAEACRYR